MSGQLKAFVSEEQVLEERQKRQAEWERVRQPDDPIECPEVETRSLFEQLHANKEYQEKESRLLLTVQDKTEEMLTSADGALAAAALPSQAGSATSGSSQKQLLSGAINRRSSDNKCDTEEKNRRISEGEASQEEAPDAKLMAGIPRNTGIPMVVAGILPGFADYAESDSSTENESNSSDSEEDLIILPPNTGVCLQRLLQDLLKKLR